MIEALRITVVGMGLVFAAMALVLGAMLLLTHIRVSHKETEDAATSEQAPYPDERAAKLRVAVIAAAIARAQSQAGTGANIPSTNRDNTLSPWQAFYRHRQHRPLGSSRP